MRWAEDGNSKEQSRRSATFEDMRNGPSDLELVPPSAGMACTRFCILRLLLLGLVLCLATLELH